MQEIKKYDVTTDFAEKPQKKRLFDGTTIESVIMEAQSFKRIGLNAPALITAIRYVEDRDGVDLTSLENFVEFVQSEMQGGN